MFNNYNLCHVKTINWEEIITAPDGEYLYVYNFTLPERECPPCDKSCSKGCWGEGPENCQRFSKLDCSPQCYQGRCFGPKPRECCHLFCAGGCTGPKQSDCLVSIWPIHSQLYKHVLCSCPISSLYFYKDLCFYKFLFILFSLHMTKYFVYKYVKLNSIRIESN